MIREAQVLPPVKGQEKVDIVRDDLDMRMPVKYLRDLFNLSSRPQFARWVVRVGQHHDFSMRCDTALKVLEIEIPDALLIREHR